MNEFFDKFKRFIRPDAVNKAYDASGGPYGAWMDERDAKRHLVGSSLMRRQHPIVGPALINLNEGTNYVMDAMGFPSKDEDYLMDKHNNELARKIEMETIRDNQGNSRKRTEQEMMDYIDQLLKESKEKNLYVDGIDPTTKQMYPKWIF